MAAAIRCRRFGALASAFNPAGQAHPWLEPPPEGIRPAFRRPFPAQCLRGSRQPAEAERQPGRKPGFLVNYLPRETVRWHPRWQSAESELPLEAHWPQGLEWGSPRSFRARSQDRAIVAAHIAWAEGCTEGDAIISAVDEVANGGSECATGAASASRIDDDNDAAYAGKAGLLRQGAVGDPTVAVCTIQTLRGRCTRGAADHDLGPRQTEARATNPSSDRGSPPAGTCEACWPAACRKNRSGVRRGLCAGGGCRVVVGTGADSCAGNRTGRLDCAGAG